MIKTDDRDELVMLENLKNYCSGNLDMCCEDCKIIRICECWKDGKIPKSWEIQYDSNSD